PELSPEGHPDDIFPLVLTSATQELFGCRADEDVTEKSPYKLLQKDDIVLDMRTRAAVSDFSPVKQIVLDYPEEEMLLVFDADFTHGQSFYLVLTPEAKNRILKPPEIEATEVFEAEVNKPPQPKHWISLGSEKEIGEDCLKETREKALHNNTNICIITLGTQSSSLICLLTLLLALLSPCPHQLKLQLRVDRTFRMPLSFSDHNSADAKDSHVQCAPYQDSRFSIKKLQSDRGTQAVPRLQSKSCQTLRMVPKDTFTQYEPRVFSVEELETILQDESLKNCCATQTPRILHALQQEEIMNVFIDDWKALGTGLEAGDWSGQASDSLVLHQAFADQRFSKDKKISCLNWHPTIYGKVQHFKAISSEEPALSGPDPALIVFYSFSDPSNPQLLLECPDDILAFGFSPSNPNIIVGGSVNGQVVLWDISAHVIYLQDLKDNKENTTPVARFCAISPVESRHKAQITDVQWLPQTFEVQKKILPDYSQLRIPSAEKLKPLEDVNTKLFVGMEVKHFTNPKFGNRPTTLATIFSYMSARKLWLHPPKFLYNQCFYLFQNQCTFFSQTHDRTLAIKRICIMCMFIPDESGRPHSAKPLLCFNYHWRVNTMQRSPFFKDIILTTGGPTFAIWKEGAVEGPLVASQYFEHECTAGCWSLSRPAVFFIGKEDGSAEVWDLLKNTSEPLQVHAHISNSKITCMKPWTASGEKTFALLRRVCLIYSLSGRFYTQTTIEKYFELETESLKNYLKGEDGCTKQNKKMEEVKRQMVRYVFCPVQMGTLVQKSKFRSYGYTRLRGIPVKLNLLKSE
uniref:Dynein axonemal intermediate chain 3 n=1 Tax=Fundulus heteroclitus TaxID=8078 RepID=A0A3Q2NPF8_FUNHE